MRHIRPTKEPIELTKWRNRQPIGNNGLKVNCNYRAIPCKDIIKEKLLEQQGYICGYTGIPINAELSHIEHVKPQTSCNEEIYEDTFYENFIAAYPKGNNCEFGARIKEDQEITITPFDIFCEDVFDFDIFGNISAKKGVYKDRAEQTIAVLHLANKKLTAYREEAIQRIYDLIPKKPSGLNNSQINEIKRKIQKIINSCNQSQKNKKLPAYAFIIKKHANLILKKLERIQKELSYQNKQKRIRR